MHHAARINRIILLTAFFSAPALAQPTPPSPAIPATPATPALPTYTLTTPVSRYALKLVRVPARPSEAAEKPDKPAESAAPRPELRPFYISATEVTWDCLDPFVYRLDLENPDAEADATTRPSKPYIPPDRGYGHEGYPAISVTFRTAEAYCEWLTEQTGLKFRLPTEDEWEHAASAGNPARAIDDEPRLGWYRENSQAQTHPVAQREPNAWGLYDTLGNAGEWVVGRDGKPVLKGGSFRTPRDRLSFTLAEKQEPSWNASDPQMPKSRWWLPDAPFAGFRIVLEADPKTGEPLKAGSK
jgi:formylglycine-generating enzyme required for sulfatase activity